jgi:hypothetical protein
MSLPAIVPSRRHRQNRNTNAALAWNVCSLRSEEMKARASEDVLRGEAGGAPVTRRAGAEYLSHNIVIGSVGLRVPSQRVPPTGHRCARLRRACGRSFRLRCSERLNARERPPRRGPKGSGVTSRNLTIGERHGVSSYYWQLAKREGERAWDRAWDRIEGQPRVASLPSTLRGGVRSAQPGHRHGGRDGSWLRGAFVGDPRTTIKIHH